MGDWVSFYFYVPAVKHIIHLLFISSDAYKSQFLFIVDVQWWLWAVFSIAFVRAAANVVTRSSTKEYNDFSFSSLFDYKSQQPP
ncbi:hypothetical protein XELAEV_18016128mg [Xenopus laevis]|uniref:Uncharacterized protein n=1 Tax=Xenopus laevis TaxID=8355 RepID=A0A974HX24_XENLA|nr:hypothetical protein XELAEV_18016128mg [Xenopus laevis]